MSNLLLVALLLFQTTPPVVPVIPPNTSFRIAFEASPTDNLRWWCDGAIAKNFLPSDLTKGAVSPTNPNLTQFEASVPGLTAGVHSCLVSAWKPIEGSTEVWPDVKSAPITVLVGTGPITPMNLKIVVTITGTVK